VRGYLTAVAVTAQLAKHRHITHRPYRGGPKDPFGGFERNRLISTPNLSVHGVHTICYASTRMGGWFVDIFVEYLFRVVARMVKRRGSGTWPIAKGTVTSSACANASYGCDVAEVCYTYRVDGELYAGINQKPFILHNSGENYAGRFAAGTAITVRVKPGEPSASVREGDQISHPR
jgi:hypothetical protein